MPLDDDRLAVSFPGKGGQPAGMFFALFLFLMIAGADSLPSDRSFDYF